MKSQGSGSTKVYVCKTSNEATRLYFLYDWSHSNYCVYILKRMKMANKTVSRARHPFLSFLCSVAFTQLHYVKVISVPNNRLVLEAMWYYANHIVAMKQFLLLFSTISVGLFYFAINFAKNTHTHKHFTLNFELKETHVHIYLTEFFTHIYSSNRPLNT